MNVINRMIDRVTNAKPVLFVPDDNYDDQAAVQAADQRRPSPVDQRDGIFIDIPAPIVVLGVDEELKLRKKVEKYSFSTAFVFSFFTMLFCGFFFGAVAMLLAVCANRTALYKDKLETARRLGIASYIVSFIGFGLGTALVAALVLNYAYTNNHDNSYPPLCWSQRFGHYSC